MTRAIRIKVEHGQITGEAPAGLPDGEHDLCLVDDDDDDMTDDELAQLDAVIERSLLDAKAGRVVAADDLLAALRARR